jgi:hypothetical protein
LGCSRASSSGIVWGSRVPILPENCGRAGVVRSTPAMPIRLRLDAYAVKLKASTEPVGTIVSETTAGDGAASPRPSHPAAEIDSRTPGDRLSVRSGPERALTKQDVVDSVRCHTVARDG